MNIKAQEGIVARLYRKKAKARKRMLRPGNSNKQNRRRKTAVTRWHKAWVRHALAEYSLDKAKGEDLPF